MDPHSPDEIHAGRAAPEDTRGKAEMHSLLGVGVCVFHAQWLTDTMPLGLLASQNSEGERLF